MHTGHLIERGVIIPLFIFIGTALGLLLLFSPDINETVVVWGTSFFFVYLFLFTVWLSRKYHTDKKLLETYFQIPTRIFRIRIPPNAEYTPGMMEYVINALPTIINPKTRGPQFSFEIVAHEGIIHFFIRTPEEYVGHIQSAFSTAFPDVLIEETDATLASPVSFLNEEYTVDGIELDVLGENYLPIRTHRDVASDGGVDSDTLGLLLYLCDATTVDEHIFFQVVVRGNIFDRTNRLKNKVRGLFGLRSEQEGWEDAGRKGIETFVEENRVETEGVAQKMDELARKQLKHMREKLHYQTYTVGVRALYVARKTAHRDSFKQQLKSIFEPLNVLGYNPIVVKDTLGDAVYAYEYRMFFHPPVNEQKSRATVPAGRQKGQVKEAKNHLVLAAPEIATLFHLPAVLIPGIREQVARPAVSRDIPS